MIERIKFESSRFEQKTVRPESFPIGSCSVGTDKSKMQNRISSLLLSLFVVSFTRESSSEIEVARHFVDTNAIGPRCTLARIFKLNCHEIEVSRGKEVGSFSPFDFRLSRYFRPPFCQLHETHFPRRPLT